MPLLPRVPRSRTFLVCLASTLALIVGLLSTTALHAAPAALEGLTLVDQKDQRFLTSLNGRVVLLNFVFTQCSRICPTQTLQLARVYDRLTPELKDRVRFVSVSVDPLSDTPKALAAYARKLQAERPGWHFATGPAAEVFDLAERMRVLVKASPKDKTPPPEDHRTALYLFRSDGQLVQRFRGDPPDEKRLALEIATLADPHFLASLKP